MIIIIIIIIMYPWISSISMVSAGADDLDHGPADRRRHGAADARALLTIIMMIITNNGYN